MKWREAARQRREEIEHPDKEEKLVDPVGFKIQYYLTIVDLYQREGGHENKIRILEIAFDDDIIRILKDELIQIKAEEKNG